ncbi:alpha-L-fucosidase [Pedobacter sp. PWIIR3]
MNINRSSLKALTLGLMSVVVTGSLHANHLKDTAGFKSPIPAIVETSRTAWWEKARFGMFIHWGVYTIPAGKYNGKDMPGLGEWIMHDASIPVATYKEYAKQFNPTQYDPEAWVKMAKDAGMKYIVITTKHHDGFALFDTKASDWSVVKATPYGKDLIKPLAEACRKLGMKLGFYYSQANDWGNKGGAAARGHWDKDQEGSMDEYIDKVAVPQVREILTNYGDVAELWWDVPTGMTKERAAKFLPLLKLQPQIITNDRLGGDIKGDLFTPEQYIPATGIKGLWETCMTMNDTWGYKTDDHNWKSSKQLIRNLIEASSKGGNYLLNVGPEPTGKFPAPIVQRLADIGKWMKVNSESIYGTVPGPFKVIPWGKVTEKPTTNGNSILYLHVFNWPKDGKLLLPGLSNSLTSAQLLADRKSLVFKKEDGNVIINVPQNAPDETATVIKIIVKGKPVVTPFIQGPEADGSIVLYPGLAEFSAPGGAEIMRPEGGEEQNIGFWTDARSSAIWQFNVKVPGTYTLETYVGTSSATSVVKLSSGDQVITKAIPKTAGYNDYVKVTLGKFTFSKAGLYTIKLSAETNNWAPVNMKKIVLIP